MAMNRKNVDNSSPGSTRWLESKMTKLFGRQERKSVSMGREDLSHSVCPNKLTTALDDVRSKSYNEMLARQNSSTTIKAPDRLRSCMSNSDRYFDKVPECFSHAITPCQTPDTLPFDKNMRPAVYKISQEDRRSPRRAIDLLFPEREKKNVSFFENSKSISSYDEVVNRGGSGFRILSIVDHETNTITFPKYEPPKGFRL
ncbi:hypothetical protein CAEBREN_10838 [Caenorhabditis brenneri]|uniref:Uncharacterized protein n=1 Tax=Caenorhabditis brenneri TaxID=135651 RepID=G0P0P0_CAEBE|nr:hypothetical protein CAEBREN_10838 [Caenorhabditis brenneri]